MILADARHEKFAVLIAQGTARPEAYRMAGFKTNNCNSTSAAACRLMKNPGVKARI